jgi:hypothetical protein
LYGHKGTVDAIVGEEFLLSVMAFSTNKGPYAERVGPIGSIVLKINKTETTITEKWKSGKITVEGPCTVITDSVVKTQYDAVICAKQDLMHTVKHIKSTRRARDYLASAFVESDWVYKGRYILSPAVSGWPQQDRLRFDVGIYWPRAVAVACHLLQPDVVELLKPGIHTDILDILVVVTLTVFAGNYPLVAESRDDRGLGAIKLDLNRDCDDMAITACAVFNRMKQAPAGEGTLASLIHAHLHTFVEAATIVCEANGKVSVPGQPEGTPTGHVCAVLCRESGQHMLRGGLIVESTRPSSPFELPLDTYMTGTERAFSRPTYAPTDEGIMAVKPLIVAQYIELFMIHTRDTSYVCVAEGALGASLEDMLSGAGTALPIQCNPNAKYIDKFNALSHRPCYEQMDKVCIDMGWDQKLGTHAHTPAIYPSTEVFVDYTQLANPREAHAPALFITQFIAYCFI